MCILFAISTICCQYIFIWLIDDGWSSLLLICIFRALIVNFLVFHCASLHWRLYLFTLLIGFIEYSMLLHLILRTYESF